MTDSRNLLHLSSVCTHLKREWDVFICSFALTAQLWEDRVRMFKMSPVALWLSSLTGQIPQAPKITVRGLKSQCLSIYKVFDIKEVSLYWKHSITTGVNHPWFISHLTVSLRCNWHTVKFTILSIEWFLSKDQSIYFLGEKHKKYIIG